MKKVLLSVFLLASISVFAQDDEERGFRFGLGGNLSLPMGDLKEDYSYGVGFEIEPSYGITENIETFMQAGINVFRAKSQFGGDNSNGLLHIPILVGGRYKVSGFFAGAGVGYGLWTASGASSNGFMYSPQVGYGKGKLELALHYSSTTVTGGSLSYFGLKIFRKF